MNKNCGNGITLIISLLLAILVGVGVFFLVIPSIIIAVWIAFGLAAAILFFIGFASLDKDERKNKCLCKTVIKIIILDVVTILISIFTVVLTSLAIPILNSLLIGGLTLFFVLTLLEFIGYLICLINLKCVYCN